MALVGHPRPVNPRPRLAAVAAQRGWPVLRVTARAAARVRSLLGKAPDAILVGDGFLGHCG